jgi:hypothetical protein
MPSTSPLDLISTLAINCGEAYSSPCIILIEITTTSEAIDLELKLGMMNARVFGAGDNKDSRETVVLAHGYGSSQFIWDDVVPTLAARFRVVVFDWSFSAAADGKRYCCSYSGLTDELVALMDELGVRNATFVGHFMAGMLGCIASCWKPCRNSARSSRRRRGPAYSPKFYTRNWRNTTESRCPKNVQPFQSILFSIYANKQTGSGVGSPPP